MDMCYNHMFIYAEFEIINMFFKERRSKYKPVCLSIRNVFYMFHVYTQSSVWSWTCGLKSCRSIGPHVSEPCFSNFCSRCNTGLFLSLQDYQPEL